MAGEKDQMVGKGKEMLGNMTGNNQMEAEGKTQNIGGKVSDAAQGVKDSVTGAVNGAVNAASNLMGNNK